MTTIHQDWKEFLSALLSENTKFLLIGAHALAFHVEARLTEDLDVFIEPSPENARKVLAALKRFGFGSLIADAAELAIPNRVFMLGPEALAHRFADGDRWCDLRGSLGDA